MSLKICRCGYGISNFGTRKCPNLMDVTYKLIFVPYLKTDGTINGLDLDASPALDSAYFLALVNAAQTLAWRPTPQVMNYDSAPGEQQFEDFNDGQVKLPTSKTPRQVKFVIPELPAVFVNKFESMGCEDVGVYMIDESGNLHGMNAGWKKLNPILVQKRSVYSQLVLPKYKSVQQVMVGFTIDPTMNDGDLGTIQADDMTYDLRNILSLIDADIVLNEAIAQSNTGFAVNADTYQGDIYTPDFVEGLVKADFTLVNQTTGATITITTVTEVAPGYYTFVVPAQTVGVYYKLTCIKAGFNFYPLLILGVA